MKHLELLQDTPPLPRGKAQKLWNISFLICFPIAVDIQYCVSCSCTTVIRHFYTCELVAPLGPVPTSHPAESLHIIDCVPQAVLDIPVTIFRNESKKPKGGPSGVLLPLSSAGSISQCLKANEELALSSTSDCQSCTACEWVLHSRLVLCSLPLTPLVVPETLQLSRGLSCTVVKPLRD